MDNLSAQIDQLLAIIEISIVLAGFAAMVATFQSRKMEGISRGHVVSLAMIVYISLFSALLAAFSLTLLNFRIEASYVWSISSCLMGVATTGFIVYLWKKRHFKFVSTIMRITYYGLFVIASSVVVISTLNVAGIIFEREFGPYFLAYICNLFFVGFAFARLLMRPLWKAVETKEVSVEHRGRAKNR
ncbi:hypothetical protein MO867_11380 [Microbulbifer sp. OS29]|uniref:Uncharacterized protein n=1 Tax=Microbulbifer okhotskensis TaxID=2926617 RepID=A0A9X2EPH4_9GAMM|nr:hypothetical protein [Microbulbifer okhotskensis]MCO1334940.1 hypothetical protein [Microbulbifer okhotskensis]